MGLIDARLRRPAHQDLGNLQKAAAAGRNTNADA